MTSELLFAYGTLLPGEPAAIALRHARSLGPATWRRAELFDLGKYPAARDGDGDVHGELFELDPKALAEADGIEGFFPDDPESSLFRRERRPILLWEPESVQDAWVHVYPHSLDERTRLPGGDWRARLR